MICNSCGNTFEITREEYNKDNTPKCTCGNKARREWAKAVKYCEGMTKHRR